MAMQKFSATSHKPIKIQCLKIEKVYNETLLHFKKLLYIVNILCGFFFSLNSCFYVLRKRCIQIHHHVHCGIRCHSLWLSFEHFSLLSTLAWWYLIPDSELAKLICVAHDLWHGVPSSKSGIKLFFCNWLYLALFK